MADFVLHETWPADREKFPADEIRREMRELIRRTAISEEVPLISVGIPRPVRRDEAPDILCPSGTEVWRVDGRIG